MIRCLIIDDEPSAIKVLTHLIEKISYLELAHATNNPVEGIKLANENMIDLIFMDIKMPEMNGLETISAIDGKSRVILTTAYPEYAIKGYELDVIDYLLKPIPLSRFVIAAEKARNIILKNPVSDNTETYIEGDHIYVKTESKGKLLKIDFPEIDYIEAVGNYVSIHRGKLQTLVYANLKDLEELLPKSKFIRIHRSYIISMSKISGIESSCVLLKDLDVSIPFGELYKKDFLERIKDRLI